MLVFLLTPTHILQQWKWQINHSNLSIDTKDRWSKNVQEGRGTDVEKPDQTWFYTFQQRLLLSPSKDYRVQFSKFLLLGNQIEGLN